MQNKSWLMRHATPVPFYHAGSQKASMPEYLVLFQCQVNKWLLYVEEGLACLHYSCFILFFTSVGRTKHIQMFGTLYSLNFLFIPLPSMNN